MPITVNAVNDAPVNTVPAPQTVAEDTTLPIPGLSVADVDGTVLTTTLTVASGTLTIPLRGGGLITGNGTNSLVINGTATQINNALATLHYHGNLDFNGSDTLTVTTSDGSLSDTDTVPITVNAVNDAPVNTVPGPQTVAEDTTLPIAGVSVADVDSTTLTTTLSVTNGTLNVTTGGGAVIAGDGTATVTISGTAAQINNALAGLSYLGNLDFHGSDTLTVATSTAHRATSTSSASRWARPAIRRSTRYPGRKPSTRTRCCRSPASRSRTWTAPCSPPRSASRTARST